MNKLFLLAFAGMRKAKAQTVVLIGLFLIASMMMGMSLMILLDFNQSFENMAKELNTSDMFFAIPELMYTEEVEQYFIDHEYIDDFQTYSSLFVNITNPSEAVGVAAIANWDESRTLSQWQLVGDAMPEDDDGIYVPYHFKVSGGYQLGDAMNLEIEGGLHNFTIVGFSESLFQNGGPTIDDVFFIPGTRFAELSRTLSDFRFALVFANGAENHARIEMELLQLTGSQTLEVGRSTISSGDLASFQNFRTLMPSVIAAMLLVFTSIVTTVCLLVIHFKIKNSIDEDMPQLGLLQAVGFTSHQLTIVFILQYVSITLISCLFGIAFAYLAIPVVGDLFAQQSSFFWNPSFQAVPNIGAISVLITIVMMTVLRATKRIRTITPIQALRVGIQTHNFKKNYLPLEHSKKLSMPMMLAFKSVLQNKRQSIFMLVIVASVCFVSTIATVMYYNAVVDVSIFQTVPGVERMDARMELMPKTEEEIFTLREEVRSHPDVKDAEYLDIGITIVNDEIVGVVVMENYETRRIHNVYEGVFPRHENEIVISGFVANLLKVGVGDTVFVGEDALPYLITGLSQGMEAGGVMTTYLTLAGMRRIQGDFSQSSLAIYVNDGVDVPEFIGQMELEFAGRHFFVADSYAIFNEGMAPFITIMSSISVAIIFISSAVILLALYFVIGSAITRRRRELGIQKALGYTTFSQMQQITLGFSAPILLAVVVGCFIGGLTTNMLMSIGMQAAGVMQINYIIRPTWVMATGVGIMVLSYASSLLMTWRIRKISAYTLVSEG